MKYLKLFEKYTEEDLKKNRVERKLPELIPGQMYMHHDTPVCFIGVNSNENFPCTCLLFFDFASLLELEFIEWIYDIELIPMNMTINDYIIENNIVLETLKAFEKPQFASGHDRKVVKKFEKELLKDERIRIYKETSKYNV